MKYGGMVLIILMLGSLLYNGDKVIQLISKTPTYSYSSGHNNQLLPLIETAQGFSRQTSQIEQLTKMLDRLNQATQARNGDVNLISLPIVAKTEEQEPVAAPVKRRTPKKFKYSVTMVYVSPTDKYAVIDGDFAREGETLTNGAKVISISKGTVVLLKQGVKQTVRISG